MKQGLGILVQGGNHWIVRGPLPNRETALALVRHWSRGSSALLVERFKRRLMGSFVPDSVLLRLGFEAEEGWHDHTFAASAS
jgi:hypothetical protein